MTSSGGRFSIKFLENTWPFWGLTAIAVLLTLVSFSDAYATTPACDAIVSGSIIFDDNLTCTTTSGLIIGADGTTIDLAGFTLSGATCSGCHGIQNNGGFDNVTIQNGIINGFEQGVRGVGVTNYVLDNLTFTGQTSSHAVDILDSVSATIRNSSFTLATPTDVGPEAIRLESVGSVTVSNVNIVGGFVGVNFACGLCDGTEAVTNGNIIDSTIDGASIGVLIANSDDATITNNEIKNGVTVVCSTVCGPSPLTLDGKGVSIGFNDAGQVTGVTITNNQIFNNDGFGVRVRSGNTAGVDASSNWWGDSSGPGGVGAGAGDGITAKVDFSPFCTNVACSATSNIIVDDVGDDVFNTIQEAIDAASDGDIIDIEEGIYSNSITVSKELTLDGKGDNTNIQTPVILSASSTISNLKSSDFAGTAFTITTDDTFVFDSITIENVGGNGIITKDDGGTVYNSDITIRNSNFKNNGLIATNNPADLEIFRFEGILLVENVNIVKAVQDTDKTNTYGIEIRGDMCNGASSSAATVTLNNVIISGAPNKEGLLIQCYSDTAGFSFTDVDLSGVVTDPTKFFQTSIVIDNADSATLDLGNTILRNISIGGDVGASSVDATNVIFVGTTSNFEIEDVVFHAVDVPTVGLVTWNANNLYVTPTSNGLQAATIQNAINAASNGDTINVAAGTYPIGSAILIDKPLTLLGPQANVDPRPSSSTIRTIGDDATEAIIDGGGSVVELLQIDADNVVINGFEIKSGTGDLIKSEGDVIQSPIIRYNIIYDATGDEGIQLKNVDNALIEYNHVFDTFGDGINIAFSHDSIIQFNEVHDIDSLDAAIYMYNDNTRSRIDGIIQNNLVYDVTNNDGIKLGDKSGLDELLSGGSILNNVIHDTRQDSITVKASNVIVEGNEISRSASENGAIYVDFNPHDITITNNIIQDNGIATIDGADISDPATTYGIRVGKGTDQATNVIINNNKIQGNEGGVFFNFQGGDDLDARENYWGHSKGPLHSDANPNGQGNGVSDNVSFDPWYLNSKLKQLSSEKSGNKLAPQGNSVQLDSSNNGDVTGQASLPDGVEELELNNDAVLDLATNIVTATDNDDGDITIGGELKKLKSFNSGKLIGVDLTVEQTVGDKKVIVKKAVKMKSGTNGQPIIIKNVALPSVSISIPDETTILASDEWDGTIQPPKTGSSSGAAPSAFTVGNVVIEVGSPDVILLFDTPVILTLEGVTGNVGYKPAGSDTWIQITNTCSSFADPASGLVFPGECSVNDGSNTKIATFHFTEFGSLDKKSGKGCADCIKPVLESNLLSSPDSNIYAGTLKLDDSARNSASIFETGDTIDFELSFYENSGAESMNHVTLFTNIQGFEDRYDSNLYVEWDKYKPLKVYDPEGYLDDTTDVSFIVRDANAVMTFHLNFVKPMDTSNIVLYYWDYFRNSGIVTFEDALVIVEPVEDVIAEFQAEGIITNDDTINDSIDDAVNDSQQIEDEIIVEESVDVPEPTYEIIVEDKTIVKESVDVPEPTYEIIVEDKIIVKESVDVSEPTYEIIVEKKDVKQDCDFWCWLFSLF